MVPPRAGTSLPLIKSKQAKPDDYGLSTFGDRDYGGFTSWLVDINVGTSIRGVGTSIRNVGTSIRNVGTICWY